MCQASLGTRVGIFSSTLEGHATLPSLPLEHLLWPWLGPKLGPTKMAQLLRSHHAWCLHMKELWLKLFISFSSFYLVALLPSNQISCCTNPT